VFKFATINVFPGKQLSADQPLTDQLPPNQHPPDQPLANQSLTDQLQNSTEVENNFCPINLINLQIIVYHQLQITT